MQSNHPQQTIIQSNTIMGAKVSIAAPDTGMFLIIGNISSPTSLMQQYGGSLIMKLSTRSFLVTLPFHAYLELKKNPEIQKIGPVSIDMERFNRTIKMLTGNFKIKR